MPTVGSQGLGLGHQPLSLPPTSRVMLQTLKVRNTSLPSPTRGHTIAEPRAPCTLPAPQGKQHTPSLAPGSQPPPPQQLASRVAGLTPGVATCRLKAALASEKQCRKDWADTPAARTCVCGSQPHPSPQVQNHLEAQPFSTSPWPNPPASHPPGSSPWPSHKRPFHRTNLNARLPYTQLPTH